MEVGNRVYYIESTGQILCTGGEINNADKARDANESIKFIDLEYGSIDYTKNMIVGIDLETKTPILQPIENDQDKHIRELEDALLLQTDSETGGIL
ncbi:hypothetical protein ABFY48_01855 [Lysinibacillus pakistanensis]|uniref:hypothetical protein n=1 Tax=Lysinibacillus pakistanensis TaxID=759811 RepID=UPI003D2B6032